MDQMKKNKNKNKAVEKMYQFLFSRTAVVGILLFIQVFIITDLLIMLSEYFIPLLAISWVVTFIVIVQMLNRRGNPAFKQTWTIIILAIPIVGVFFYLFCRFQVGEKKIHERLDELWIQIRPILTQDDKTIKRLYEKKTPHIKVANYLYKQAGYPIYDNTEVVFYRLGEEKLEGLLEELKKAEKFIFMEYFIIEFGYMWDSVLTVLKQKVAEGVEVRLMYDGTNTISYLPYDYYKQMRKLGINCKVFNPIQPILTTSQNNRDHRKICVIDGNVGFTGGINLGDEYINRIERFGHWKDTAVMLRGEAVKSLTMMFLQLWNMEEKTSDNYKKYIPTKNGVSSSQTGFVLPYGDIPMDSEDVGEQVYAHIINNAQRYVHIMTPYLILDNEMLTNLTGAAKSGIEVIIIMPHIPDKGYAFAVAKTYYEELIQAGVQIYEYTPGFVHAKIFVSDDSVATVGTINLDYRSLYLHYECGVFIYENPIVRDIELDFQETLSKCVKISILDIKSRDIKTKVIGNVLRVLAPLM